MISIYCSEKLDGIASAAIIMRHATMSGLPAHFGGFLHPDTLMQELEEIAGNEKKLIFMLDIGARAEHLPVLDKICIKNKIVYWSTNDAESIVPPSKIFDRAEGKQCSAFAVCNRFLPTDQIAKKLAELAYEVKFWQMHDERSTKLSDLIAAQYSPVELIENLSKGMFWNEKLEEHHKAYNERKNNAFEEMMQTLTVKSYVNNGFGFALTPQILNGADACQKILNSHAGVDVAVAIYRDGRICLRRKENCTVNVKELAEIFNGGGLPFAAGARIKAQATKESFPEVLLHIDGAFRNYFVRGAVI